MAFSALEPSILSSLPSYASLTCFGLDEEMKSSKGRCMLAREDLLLRALVMETSDVGGGGLSLISSDSRMCSYFQIPISASLC